MRLWPHHLTPISFFSPEEWEDTHSHWTSQVLEGNQWMVKAPHWASTHQELTAFEWRAGRLGFHGLSPTPASHWAIPVVPGLSPASHWPLTYLCANISFNCCDFAGQVSLFHLPYGSLSHLATFIIPDFSEYVYQVLFKNTTEIFTMTQYSHIPEIYPWSGLKTLLDLVSQLLSFTHMCPHIGLQFVFLSCCFVVASWWVGKHPLLWGEMLCTIWRPKL